MLNDDILFEGIKQSNEGYYEIVFRKYYPALCRFATKYIEDRDEVEDIVQETFVTIWQKRESMFIQVSLKSYLYQAVKNTCLNHIKHAKVKLKSQQDILSESAKMTGNDTLVDTELSIKIQEALYKLPPERKKIFLLKKNEGLKYKEIAEKLNISIKTVENQMGKALKFLRIELKEFLPVFVLIISKIITFLKW